MHKVARALVCLACAGHGRRLHTSSLPKQFQGFGDLIEIEPSSSSKQSPSSLIFLHGLGDSARGWQHMPTWLQFPELKYVLPSSEVLSIPGAGAGVACWFDASVIGMLAGPLLANIGNLNKPGGLMGANLGSIMGTVGPNCMQRSIAYIHYLIRQEINRGVPADRIFVGGFSMGGCIAVRAAISFPDAALGGCLALSTFLGNSTALSISNANAKLQVLTCHGDSDRVVPFAEGRRLYSSLRGRGIDATFHSYPGLGHGSNSNEAQDVRRFLKRRLIAQEGLEGLRNLSGGKLKALLKDLGIDTSRCIDKDDLLELARQTVLQ